MVESAIAAETAEVLDVDPGSFQSRVEDDADRIKDLLDDGAFDNPQGIVGLEYEFYAVLARGASARNSDTERTESPDSSETDAEEDSTYGTLARVPRRLLELIGFEKELGLHNAEMSTSPQPMNPQGLKAQEYEVKARLAAAIDRSSAEGMALVSDGMWTIPPDGETAREYLTDCVDDDGIRIATNMSDAARYHAMANVDSPAGMRVDAPNVELQAETVMPESLITSIQPHYQVPHARDLPSYFRYAIRIAGPLLALGVNSPLFPPDLYDDVPPDRIVDEAWMEHRISVFETTLNAEDVRKVKFPRDVATVKEAIDRIAEDPVFVPMPVDRGERFDDQFAHFRMKHGTYWRWVRPVFGGASKSDANARIEFRPLPGQPTVRDAIAFQAAFAGLVEGMRARDHAVSDLDWEDARDNFYGAMRDGLDANLTWITADGLPTTRRGVIYDDMFEAAVEGLQARGFTEEGVAHYLAPLRERVRRGITPAQWKLRHVKRRIEDRPLAEAVYGTQREYIRRQSETLVDGSFADWMDDSPSP